MAHLSALHGKAPNGTIGYKGLNKDSRFRKDSQYVVYLLWQKEMRETAADVYNLMKGTRQHALPVGEFMD